MMSSETAVSCERQTEHTLATGVVLPLVLIILMAIAIVSMGYLWRSDLELAYGRNMVLRMQMDSLAQSGLEHAKGLILNPQDVPSEYRTGNFRQQLLPESDDYYDVNVVRLSECNYQIVSTAYRLQGDELIGCAALKAELRLDPCIAYWQRGNTVIPPQAGIRGDVYCGGRLAVQGIIDGDVFAATKIDIAGRASGQKHSFAATAPVISPELVPADFTSHYYIERRVYMVDVIGTDVLCDVQLQPTALNPASIHYCTGPLRLKKRVEIHGMLVVEQDLVIEDECDVVVKAVKNFPALLVGHDVKMKGTGQHLRIEGLTQIGRCIDMGNEVGNTVQVTGALCILAGGLEQTTGGALVIKAGPDKAAIQVWPAPGTAKRWSPAGGAFFKSIERQ